MKPCRKFVIEFCLFSPSRQIENIYCMGEHEIVRDAG